MISFRLEKAGDADKIYNLTRKTYGRLGEATLVEDLCRDGDALVSFVAVKDDELVGHILISDAPVVDNLNLLRAAALAPLTVSAAYEGQGIGGGLVMHGLRQCRKLRVQVVFVLGDPGYYERFGFSAELAAPFTSPYAGENFQAVELEPGILQKATGDILHAEAFRKLR